MDTTSLDAAVASFIDFTRSLPAASLELSQTDRWGPREVLIHIVYWHEQYARISEALLAKKRPDLPVGTGKALNRIAVEQNRSIPVDLLITRLEKANHEFARVARGRGAAALAVPLRQKSKAWPIVDLIRLAASHIQHHEAKLRKELKLPRVRTIAAASH